SCWKSSAPSATCGPSGRARTALPDRARPSHRPAPGALLFFGTDGFGGQTIPPRDDLHRASSAAAGKWAMGVLEWRLLVADDGSTRSMATPDDTRAALSDLYAPLAPALHAWACMRLGPEDRLRLQPEDLTQEVWLRAFKVFHGFDPSRAS